MVRKQLIFLVLIICLGLFGLAHLWQDPPAAIHIEPSAERPTQQPLNNAHKPSPNQPAKLASNQPPSTHDSIAGVPTDQWLAELSDFIYSDDPVVEAATLSLEFRKCTAFNRLLGNQSDKLNTHADWLNKIKEQCQSYADDYPLWFAAKEREKNILSLTANSLTGEQWQYIIQGYYGIHTDLTFDELIQANLKLGLNSKNPALTSFGALDSGIGLVAGPEVNEFFANLLQTQVGMWVYQANRLALQSLSCEFPNSRSCEDTAFFMLYTCETDDTTCGLSFNDWYQSHTTEGMKKDVEILLHYYRETYP